MKKENVYWTAPLGGFDDFGKPITNKIIDGKTKSGPWAIMSEESYKEWGGFGFGVGRGQLYELQPDGKWLQTKGGEV